VLVEMHVAVYAFGPQNLQITDIQPHERTKNWPLVYLNTSPTVSKH